MVESSALVTVPFYAPVRVEAGAFSRFGQPSRRALVLKRAVQPLLMESVDGTVYLRNGRLSADWRIGSLIDIYV